MQKRLYLRPRLRRYELKLGFVVLNSANPTSPFFLHFLFHLIRSLKHHQQHESRMSKLTLKHQWVDAVLHAISNDGQKTSLTFPPGLPFHAGFDACLCFFLCRHPPESCFFLSCMDSSPCWLQSVLHAALVLHVHSSQPERTNSRFFF